MPSTLSIYSFPTKIRFGLGLRKELKAELKALGIQRPLFITDQDIAALSWFAEIENDLAKITAGTFSGLWGNPVVSQVQVGQAAYIASGADGMVAIGGGAPMDVAKAIALRAHHPGYFDYEDGANNTREMGL